MSHSRLDQIEEEIASMRDRLGRYRRAMYASRAAVACGLSTLAVGYTFVPALAATSVALSAIVCVIGGTVWLGATRSSSDELAAALERAESERNALVDGVAARNGWFDPPPGPVSTTDRRRLPSR